jgi:hypothetical protein
MAAIGASVALPEGSGECGAGQRKTQQCIPVRLPILIQDAHADLKIRGNAIILPRTKQLAVFNLYDGVHIYNFPELHGQREAHFEADSLTTQGIAVLKSGSLIASPTKDGAINLIDCNASITGVLRCKNHRHSQWRRISSVSQIATGHHFVPLMWVIMMCFA